MPVRTSLSILPRERTSSGRAARVCLQYMVHDPLVVHRMRSVPLFIRYPAHERTDTLCQPVC